MPNGDTNRVENAEAASEECGRHTRGVPEWPIGLPWRTSHRECDQDLRVPDPYVAHRGSDEPPSSLEGQADLAFSAENDRDQPGAILDAIQSQQS